MDLILVTWKDITGCDGSWMSLDEAKEMYPGPMETVGWLLKETPEYIVVASSRDTEEDTVGSVTAIPKSVIVNIKRILRDLEGS